MILNARESSTSMIGSRETFFPGGLNDPPQRVLILHLHFRVMVSKVTFSRRLRDILYERNPPIEQSSATRIKDVHSFG